jgi:hypothetical protein
VVEAPEVEAEVEEKLRWRGASVEVVVVVEFGLGGSIVDSGSRILRATAAAEIGSTPMVVELAPFT